MDIVRDLLFAAILILRDISSNGVHTSIASVISDSVGPELEIYEVHRRMSWCHLDSCDRSVIDRGLISTCGV